MLLTIIEVEQAIEKVKSGEVPGIDDIAASILKSGGCSIVKWLHESFVDAWCIEQMIKDWITMILIRLYRNKGDDKMGQISRHIFSDG